MNTLIDRLILIICCLLFSLNIYGNDVSVVYFLLMLFLACFQFLTTNKYLFEVQNIAFFILCFIFPKFLIYLPIIIYQNFYKESYYSLIIFIPLIFQFILEYSPIPITIFLSFVFLSGFLSFKTKKIDTLTLRNIQLRDTTREQTLELKKQNSMLLENQDYELKVAKLDERNRIAREIHDNVGHMLSRSILQVAALTSINKNQVLSQSYTDLQSTLTTAMNSIRNSVHNLHDNSLSLDATIKELAENYTFCPIKLSIDPCNHLNKNIKYNIISIIKEALSNAAKHSNATYVSISYKNHPSFGQLIIENDGIVSSNIDNFENLLYNGIGLKNMQDRVSILNGNINFSKENNLFCIFITFPMI